MPIVSQILLSTLILHLIIRQLSFRNFKKIIDKLEKEDKLPTFMTGIGIDSLSDSDIFSEVEEFNKQFPSVKTYLFLKLGCIITEVLCLSYILGHMLLGK